MTANVGRAALGAGICLGAGATLEVLARRIEGGWREPLTTASEPAHKLQRLRELRQRRVDPDVVFVGASVLDADIDPAVVDQELGRAGASYNACLTGSDLVALARWWEVLQPTIRPELVAIEAHPGMMLPPGTMADKLHARLDDLVEQVADERPPRRPAGAELVREGWGAALRAARRSFGVGPVAEWAVDEAPPRNHPNGHLTVFQDLDFESGAKLLGTDNWYDQVEMDLFAPWRHGAYLDLVEEVRASGARVLVVVPPLLLAASPATAPDSEIPEAISDASVEAARERGIDVVDLRRSGFDERDFADPFHLRAHATARASRVVAHAVRRLLAEP